MADYACAEVTVMNAVRQVRVRYGEHKNEEEKLKKECVRSTRLILNTWLSARK